MFQIADMVMFALSEFRRGLDGLTDDEARWRAKKADGTEMNAISWTVCHIAGHWLWRPERLDRFTFGSSDPTPPSLREAMAILDEAIAFQKTWLAGLTREKLASKPPGFQGESVGTGIMRATLHTWFHTGEINAVRQLLGHKEIPYVGVLLGNLEWRGDGES
jgi:hypothetical protein